MTDKEKAKAYDEAIEKLRSLHDDYDTISTLIDIKKELENIFPELKESEDERIRKAQLDYWRSVGGKEWHGVPVQEAIAWLEKQGAQQAVLDELEITLSVSEDAYLRSNLEKLIKEFKNDTGRKTELVEVDGFDAELNALLKKYEYLSKDELMEPLEFYLGVVRHDLDVVREEGKPKWTEEDEKCIDNCCLLIGAADDCYEKTFKDDCIHYLQRLKERMEQ